MRGTKNSTAVAKAAGCGVTRRPADGAFEIFAEMSTKISALRCGTVQLIRCGATRCSAVRCGAVRCGALRCAALRCTAMRCAACVVCAALRCGAVDRQRTPLLPLPSLLSPTSLPVRCSRRRRLSQTVCVALDWSKAQSDPEAQSELDDDDDDADDDDGDDDADD